MYGSIATPTENVHSKGGASIASSVVNLTNTIVGAGMLGLPGAFGGTGYIGGLILIILAAGFSAHGLVLLSKCAQRTGLPSSFYSVALAAVPRCTILIDLAVALKCFGVATGYLITISDSMVNALDHILLFASVLLSRRFWVVGALFAVLPFSFYRTLDELKRASALALIFVFMLVGMIISYANGVADPCAGYDDGTCRGEMAAFTDVPSTLSKLPIFVFAFTCHQNIFPIVNEIEFLSQRRVDIVIVTSIGFAMVIFSVVAIEGYRTYGFLVRGDILLNYPENAQVTFLRICIAFMLALHYPLQLDPSRRCISSLVKRIASGVDNDKHMFYGITVAFLFSSFVLAMIIDDLGVILALVGATGSTLVSYIIPGLVF
ncbi:amino acid/polyamine transporter, partial [Thalassiosira pseudonana CCMP1335]